MLPRSDNGIVRLLEGATKIGRARGRGMTAGSEGRLNHEINGCMGGMDVAKETN